MIVLLAGAVVLVLVVGLLAGFCLLIDWFSEAVGSLFDLKNVSPTA